MRSWLHTHYIALIVTAGVLLSFVVQRTDSINRQNDERNGSIERSIQTCDRGNPGRAWQQLRAIEVSSGESSQIAPIQWAILDCEKTVAANGRPIPLTPPAEEQYMALYKNHQVAIVKHGQIISEIPFKAYFDPTADHTKASVNP